MEGVDVATIGTRNGGRVHGASIEAPSVVLDLAAGLRVATTSGGRRQVVGLLVPIDGTTASLVRRSGRTALA